MLSRLSGAVIHAWTQESVGEILSSLSLSSQVFIDGGTNSIHTHINIIVMFHFCVHPEK